MPVSESDPGPQRRRLRWPPEAYEIVQQKKQPEALCRELQALSGNEVRACWRFLNKQGIRRPGAASRSRFDRRLCETLIEYISDHGVQAAAARFGYEAKTLYNLLYRQEHTKLIRDSMSLRQVCANLRVKYSQASRWIEQGLLRAERHASRNGHVSYQIEFDALLKFCREHRDLLITRRSSPSRLRFLEEYVFAPRHAELLRTRESKKEAEAFERGEYTLGEGRSQRTA